MAHMPINHPMRPLYRALAGLAAIYVLVFGLVGLAETWGEPLFGREPTHALGLRTNLAFSLLSVLVGIVVLAGLLVGRNVDRFIHLWGGCVFLGVGILMLALLQTDANFLNFTVATCIVSFVIGLVLFSAGLYGRVGSHEDERAEEAFRHGGIDPLEHTWQEEQAQPHRLADESRPELHRFG
ncbi:MAG TPA: DUF4383 domain-containing protein [Micromonosporaceae bacterium]|nr:DUF4383 domain-containing protein [Micromonosporaceae bacterium]